MKLEQIKEEFELPEKVECTLDGNILNLKGPKGNISRKIKVPRLNLTVDGNKITILIAKKVNRREKTLFGTTKSHINNMLLGVTKGHTYKLKICSGHFPMSVSVNGDNFSIKNFLGEKIPRTLKIKDGATVKLDGEIVTVESVDKEKAGQVAANIEQLTRITNKDIRIFQDGIYIIEKSKLKN